MLKELHIASQYLAAAGISFLPAEQDDSHTNLGWSVKYHSLFTRPLNEGGLFLTLSYDDFSILWMDKQWEEVAKISLAGLTHENIMEELASQAMKLIGKAYSYQFHYDLPYEKITNDYQFPELNKEEVAQLISLTTVAQHAFEKVKDDVSRDFEIRVWPHHFDLGMFVVINDQLSVGIGLAIPDSMMNEHYYYVTGWRANQPVSTEGFNPLEFGVWKSDDWNGAVLKAKNNDVSSVFQYITSAIEIFKNRSQT